MSKRDWFLVGLSAWSFIWLCRRITSPKTKLIPILLITQPEMVAKWKAFNQKLLIFSLGLAAIVLWRHL